jgi:hypothetical protein
MKRYYTIINYLLCSICLLWMTGCSGILDDMRPKDQIPQDMLSESDLEKLLNGVYAEMEELVFKFYIVINIKNMCSKRREFQGRSRIFHERPHVDGS